MLKKIRKTRAKLEEAQDTIQELAALLGVGMGLLSEASAHMQRLTPPAPQLQDYSKPEEPQEKELEKLQAKLRRAGSKSGVGR